MSVGDSNGVRIVGGGGGGSLVPTSIAVGTAVTGGGANDILFEDGSQNLGVSAKLKWDGNYVVNAATSASDPSGFTATSNTGQVTIGASSLNNGGTASSLSAITKNNGDAYNYYVTSAGITWSLGSDQSDSGKFVLSNNTTPGAQNVFTADGTTFTVVDDLVASGCSGTGTRVVQADTNGKLTATLTTTGMSVNAQSAAYPTVLADANNAILHPTADNNARTFTIDGSVSYPVGTTIVFVNQINTVTIAISTDTLTLAGAGTTGSRTLAANGVATAVKVASGAWFISGSGLS